MKQYKYDISIIVPVYNNESYIDECVNSILKQDFNVSKIQVILINDGSKDNSLNVLKKYERKNILVIDKENTGVSDTRNIGLKSAEGKYILFLDSDDYLSKDTCKNLFNLFEKNYDEIDLITYPIIYNINGKFKHHTRYKNMFKKGTGIYDLKENYNLLQATVNIFIKNKFEDNPMFNVNQNFSEDERFATEIIMDKLKIGFCKEASYYYRRHSNTANATITNAYYSFETITSYYEYLFKKYEKNGKIPKYIQALYINNLCWRIKQDDLCPYHYEKDKFEEAMNRIQKLLSKIDVDVVLSLPYMNDFHKMYVLNLKKEKLDITFKKNKFKISCKDNTIIEDETIVSWINRFKVNNDKIIINGNLATILFEIIKPKLFLEICDNKNNIKVKEIDTYITNHSYYASKMKTNTIYGYKLNIDLKDTKKFNLYTEVNDIKIPIKCKFNRFSSNRIYSSKLRINYTKKGFKINKNIIFYKLKDSIFNFIKYMKKNPKIVLYRILSKLYIKKDKIWLYTDKGGLIDNAYFQFKHDLRKRDGIKKYYIYNEPLNRIKTKFTKEEQKYLIKFKSLKHKVLFLKSDKILSSFSDLQVYCPYNAGIKWYRDITKYDFIYLQHGILHANLVKMYSKEFTEIDKFVVSSNFEENNLIEKYNYDKEDFIKSGMPRMVEQNKKIKEKNKILFAPSWREYLIGNLENNKRKLKTSEFLKSSYFKETYDFLHSKELQEFLEKKQYKLEFKLHPIFKEYTNLLELKKVKNIEINFNKTIIEEYKIFITDFSSFQFDFVKLKKPIIYFMPDMLEFKAGLHTYRELDLNYEDAFGKLCLDSNDLLKEIKRIDKNNCNVDKKYYNRMDEFFIEIKNPCEDIYDEIKKA